MGYLNDLHFFVQVARATSLSEAARRLDVSPAAASAAIKRLEAELGTKLMVRSTRNLRLTQAAEVFLEQCTQGLEQIQSARESLVSEPGDISGELQLSLPSDLGRQKVLGWLHDFRERYPQLRFRLQMSDRLASMFRESVDVVLRYGEPSDSSLVALPVAPHNRRILCASPDYLREHGAPTHPEELRQHACLCFQLSSRIHNQWQFTQGRESIAVDVSGPVISDDGDAVRQMALLGEGIVYKSKLDVAQDLDSGRLVALCIDWQTEAAPLYMACTDRSQWRPAVKRLREFLIERIQADCA